MKRNTAVILLKAFLMIMVATGCQVVPENRSDIACVGGLPITDNSVPLEQSCAPNHSTSV